LEFHLPTDSKLSFRNDNCTFPLYTHLSILILAGISFYTYPSHTHYSNTLKTSSFYRSRSLSVSCFWLIEKPNGRTYPLHSARIHSSHAHTTVLRSTRSLCGYSALTLVYTPTMGIMVYKSRIICLSATKAALYFLDIFINSHKSTLICSAITPYTTDHNSAYALLAHQNIPLSSNKDGAVYFYNR